MDGTLIPLDGDVENRRDLSRLCRTLEQHQLELLYVTGRHHQLVLDAVRSYELPLPGWLICDVGASIYKRTAGDSYSLVEAYHAHLADRVGDFKISKLSDQFADQSQLRLQEEEKQGRFKLSYYCAADQLEALTSRLARSLDQSAAPYRIISSIDPFTGDGLIDFLPHGVSKDFALRWWVEHTNRDEREIVFAGDSGNDLAALTAGYRSIVVANAAQRVVQQVKEAHRSAGWSKRLFLAKRTATSGVLEGLVHFLTASD